MDITENPEGFFSNLSSIANDEKPKEEKIEKPEEPKTSNVSITEDPESFFSNLSKTPEQKSQEETGGDFFKTAYKAIDEFLVQPKAQQEPTPDQSFLTSIQKKKASDLDKFDVDYIKSLTPDQRYSVMQARKDIPLDILSDDEQRQLHESEKSKGILSFPKEKGFWYNLMDGYNELAKGSFDILKTGAKVGVGAAELGYRFADVAGGDYGAALEGEKLLSPEARQEIEQWRVNAQNLADTPMSSEDPRQKEVYSSKKYLEKVLEKLTPEQRQQISEERAKKIADARSAGYSFMAPAFELPGDVANAAKTILAGGIGIGDWGNEKIAAALGPEMKKKAKEISFANWKARRKIKQAHEAYTREIPDVYKRMYENPALKSALNEITLFQGPSVEETAKSRGISEDAAKELLKNEAEKNNEAALKELEQQLPEVSESAKLTGEFLLPRGIGMGLFGAAGLATEATKNVARGLKFLNKTEDEINAIMEADRALQRSRTAQRYAARQEIGKDVSRAGEKMEEIGQKFRPISEFVEKKTSNLSKIVLPVSGAVYGYQHEPENPILGSLKYGLGGLGLRYAKEIPAFTKELGEAIRVSAPGTTFETLGKVPEGSKIKEKILANGGKGIDNLLANAKEYAQTGIHGGALGLAVGLSSEDDPEIIKKMASDGLLYSVGTRGIQHVLGKFSVDPVIEERNRKIDDYKIYQEYKNSTPETQKNIDDLTDWNNVVQAYESKANEYKDELNDAIQSGDKAKIEKAQSNVNALDSSIKNLKKANLQTRNELGRQFLKSYVAANELANSALLLGQNNVGFHILTTNEIFQKLRSDPANANVPDADIAKTAAQQGFYSGIGTAEHVPGAPITPGETGMTFDRTKNSIVLNADALRDRMVKYRQTPIDALWHELSHYLFKIPEFRKLMENVESSLFSTEVKDISGKVIASTSGIYSPKDLVDMYRKSYMQGHDAASIESLAKLSGVWDESRGTLDEQKVANYMREEVMADLFGEAGQRHIASTMDGGKRSIIESAIVKTKQLILDKALARFRGLGGKGDVVRAANSGAEFSPDVMKAAKKALDAMRDLNGAISPAIEAPAKPLISKAQMAKSKAIAGRYGMDSGLFETKMTASVFDADGNKIGESMPVSDIAFEGAFQSTPQGLKQLSGYGSLPNELTGVNIPEGGKIVVGKEFVMSPDGKTPVMLSSADVKKAVKGRSNLIRTALAEHDDGSPATFRAVSDDGLTFRGTFNPEQIKAIQDLPESIVPRSIKENILKANESIAAADGTRWIMDYAAMMDDYGKYKAFAPKLYDFVPIGMHFSKDGNFLLTAINVGRIFQKMRLWNERMPGKLKMWDNNLEMAFDDFANIYLQNWKNGRPGETGLDKNPTIALVKKNIFNDLLNVTKEQYNPDISIIPRRKGDPRGKNLDRVITSFRVDHIAEMIKNEEATKLPVNYGFAKINFMPERMEGEVAETKKPVTQSERFPTPERGFYSGLQQTIDQKVQGKFASPDQIKAIVSNPQNVKAEELKWSGVIGEIDRLAAENQGKVPKDKVMEYLRNEGAVKFEEVTLGGATKIWTQSEIDALEREAQRTRNFDVYEQAVLEFEDQQLGSNANSTRNQTKYAKYQLPSGENYREVVMTMPIPPTKRKNWGIIYDGTIGRAQLGVVFKTKEEAQSHIDNHPNIKNPKVNSWDFEEESKPSYTSSHFPEIPNYVAHMRLNERTDAEGNNGLFIEELQSDRHQAGREKGYENELPSGYKVIENPQLNDPLGGTAKFFVVDQNKKIVGFGDTPKEAQDFFTSRNAGIQDAPFRKDWSLQLFKRALRDAVESGKSWIGWTTGDTQAERYDLSKQVDSVNVSRGGGNTWEIWADKDNQKVADKNVNTINEVAEVIGKDLAKKVEDMKPGESARTFSGLDLKIGGEGMKGFYDQILPKEIGKYVAKMGGKVEKSKLADGGGLRIEKDGAAFVVVASDETTLGAYETREKANERISELKNVKPSTPIWRVNITPEMAGKVKGGQLQFMPERPVEERIVAATYTDPRTGKVREGVNHKAANPNAPDEQTDRESRYYGFKTDAGRVVNREEAYRIAEASGQLKEATSEEDRFNADRGVLHSNMVDMEPTIGEKTEISPKIGADYMKAVESGDVETQQKLVDEAARNAGYSDDVYHGTFKFQGYEFKPEKRGESTKAKSAKMAYFFTSNPKIAESYFDLSLNLNEKGTEMLKKADLYRSAGDENSARKIERIVFDDELKFDPIYWSMQKTGQILDLKINTENLKRIPSNVYDEKSFSEQLKIAKDENYDGVIFENTLDPGADTKEYAIKSDVYALFDAAKIKSSDPVTYDDAGNVIPLSQRFNPKTSDIRFMPARPQDDTIKPADLQTSAKPEADAVIKPFSNALVSSAGLINFLPAYH